MKKLTLGLFGFGCVGQGLYQVWNQASHPGISIKHIAIRDPHKPRSLPSEYFTTDHEVLFNDPEIDVVVELIDDSEAALNIVHAAMKKGKAVVSANKKMIAENLQTLLEWQEHYQVPFLYEGACCASIPIIRNLEEYYDHDWLTSIRGIFNGSTNFILTQMGDHQNDFAESLQIAQEKGFAESDPSLDVEAVDPSYKLCILIYHSFGLLVKPESIARYGIGRIGKPDWQFAQQRQLKIKLVAWARKKETSVQAWCFPVFVSPESGLSRVDDEYNAVELESAFSETQLLYGKGAGDTPTGSAVLSDISALAHHYRYEYKKAQKPQKPLHLDNQFKVQVYVRYHDHGPQISDFISIEEHLSSTHGNYLIGTLWMNDLLKASWKNAPGVSLILFQ